MRMPKFSIIVPIHNAQRTLRACLDSLCALEYSENEIILVDDGSTDDSANIAETYPFKLLHLPQNLGAGEARNRGCLIAQGDILVFTDADCIVPPDWLRKIECAFRNGVDGITGVYAPPSDAAFLARFVGYDIRLRFLRLTRDANVFGTYNGAILHRVFDEVGGFNSRIPAASWEDVDFGLRVVAKGYSLIIDPTNAVIHHHPNQPLNYFLKQASKAGGQVCMRLERRRSSYIDMPTALQIPLMVLFCVSLLSLPWLPWLGCLGIFSTVISLITLNWPLLRMIGDQEGRLSAVAGVGWIIFRNIAWCAGIVQALGSVFISSWSRGRKIG